jgi:hypothetical protein
MSPSLSGPSIYSGLSSQQKGRGINHEKEGELIMRRKGGGGEREGMAIKRRVLFSNQSNK